MEADFTLEVDFGFVSDPAAFVLEALAAEVLDLVSDLPDKVEDPLAVLLVLPGSITDLPADLEPVRVGFPAAGFALDGVSFLAFVVAAVLAGFTVALFRLPVDF